MPTTLYSSKVPPDILRHQSKWGILLCTKLLYLVFLFKSCFFPLPISSSLPLSFPSPSSPSVPRTFFGVLNLMVSLTFVKQNRQYVCTEDGTVSWVWVTCLWFMTSDNPNNESISVNYKCLGPTVISSPLSFPVLLPSSSLPFSIPSSSSHPPPSIIQLFVFPPLLPLLFIYTSFFLFSLLLLLCLLLTPHPSHFLAVLVIRVSWWSFV